MAVPSEGVHDLLRDGLGEGSILHFAEAVVGQLAGTKGATADERATAHRVLALIRAAAAGRGGEAAADLHADPPLFAAFFQNLDLLVPADSLGDAVSAVLLAALERAAE